MAAQVRNYPKLAADILELVGGEKNIANASRCATRLRLVLKNTPDQAKEQVSRLPGVITVVENSGQFQVVIGPHVGEVHEELLRIADVEAAEGGEHKASVVSRVIATMSAVFAPFVYILAAAGILQGALILTTMVWPAFEETGTHAVLSFMSWTPFTFLPIFIAITASKHFKVNTFVAVLCCAAIMNPTWNEIAGRIAQGESVSLFGIPLSQTVYTSTVLPPLLLVWLLSYLEKALSRRLTGAAQQIFVPLVSLLVMVPLTLLVVGPVAAGAANGLSDGFNYLVQNVPVVAALLYGGLIQVAVIFGIHWGFLPVALANHAQYGFDASQAYQSAAVIAQVGAVIGVFLKTRNRELKGIAGSAAIPGFFGITEPTIYGVTLRLKRPFIYGCLSGAIGAAVMTFFGTVYYAFAGLPGFLTIVNAESPGTPSLLGAIVGCAVAFILAMALTYFVGFNDPVEELGADVTAPGTQAAAEVTVAAPAAPGSAAATLTAAGTQVATVTAPLGGRVVAMSDVPDPVFASGAMGGGVAIDPTDTRVYAPFDGTVVTVLKSKHAIGLRGDNGMELLIHVGLDTVALEGRGFTQHVNAKDKVKAGDLLLEFDPAVIREAGYSLITPVVVTNSKKYGQVVGEVGAMVNPGEVVARVLAKDSDA
ncbi:PTS system beta-glucosides-specific IIC component [Kineosphaera limosa]|uniref:Beta-glucoside-specific phosphotransferase system enzyme II n=1 Tax=Kineosphaera limosa NBRC 100340 TaxID=1184609 RepID=K6XAZ3_9MICO|nr:beta-glucoside-specific PTS transporter subunit IIABC [Kineosphaera limosa]NYE02486.1 PTS system beta-glucosides-specific IIC component [Kineosphaera limosa]GAB95989.1 beta-glucoside-specific phosphotransferase system enzyme II [Kineosphaera limosa NBRC 100340]